ncbi:uncharacterized protein rpgra isoform X2 [Cetorhinus maximus]
MFGSNNWGQLGLGTKNTINKPTCVKALKSEKVKLVACGRNHTLVCTEQGNVYATGDNSEGQLGLGDTEGKTTFQRVESFTNKRKIKHLAAGSNISAALTENGNLFMWGDNSEGQIGLDSKNNASVPHQVDVGKPICWVSCGYYHSAFVTEGGQLYTFGESDNGKLGLLLDHPINHRIPQPVTGISGKVNQVSCGGDHTIVLAEEDVYAFGFGQFGQLGHGTFIFESSLPKVVEQLKKKNVRFISCGENHTAVVTGNGLLYTFGDGRHGKLGLGEENFTNQFKPTLCSKFLKLAVQSVACGGCHMLVLATPRPKDSANVVIEDDDINENYLTDTYSTTLGNSSTPSTLRRALSARIRRREREMSPDKFGQLARTLPPIGASLLNSSLPISSQTIPGMKVAEENLVASKPISDVQIFEESPSPNIVPRIKEIKNSQRNSAEEESEEENDKGLGDTTDLLNMTHTVIVNPHDKTLTLSPVHKEQKRGESSGKGGQRKINYNVKLQAKKSTKVPLQTPSPRLNLHTSMLGAVGDDKHKRHSHSKAISKEEKTAGKENFVAKLNQSATPKHTCLYDSGTMNEGQNTVAIKEAQAHGKFGKQKPINYSSKAGIGQIFDLSHDDTSSKIEIPLKAVNRKAKPTSLLSAEQYEQNIPKQSEEAAAKGEKKAFIFNRRTKEGNNNSVNKHRNSGVDKSIKKANRNKSLKGHKSVKHFLQKEHMDKEIGKEQIETKLMHCEKQVQGNLEENLNAEMGKEITLQINVLKLGNKVIEKTIVDDELLEDSTYAEKGGKKIEEDEDKGAVGDEDDVTLGKGNTIADDMSAKGNSDQTEESTTADKNISKEEVQESGEDGDEIDKGRSETEQDQSEDRECAVEEKEVIEGSNDEEGDNSDGGDESNSKEARGNMKGGTKRNKINAEVESGTARTDEDEGNEDVFEGERNTAEENEPNDSEEGKSAEDDSEEDEGGKHGNDESERRDEEDESNEEEDGSDKDKGQSREDEEEEGESSEEKCERTKDEDEEQEGEGDEAKAEGGGEEEAEGGEGEAEGGEAEAEGEEEEGEAEGQEEEGEAEGQEEEGEAEGQEEEGEAEGQEEEGEAEGEEEEGEAEGEEEEGEAEGEEEEGEAEGEEEEGEAEGEEEKGEAEGEEEEGEAEGQEEEGEAEGEEEEGEAEGEEEEGEAEGEEEEGEAEGEEEEGEAEEEEAEGEEGEAEGEEGEAEGEEGEAEGEEGEGEAEEEGEAGEEEEGEAEGEEEEGEAEGEEEEGEAEGEEEEEEAEGEEGEGEAEGEEEEGEAEGEEEEGEAEEEEEEAEEEEEEGEAEGEEEEEGAEGEEKEGEAEGEEEEGEAEEEEGEGREDEKESKSYNSETKSVKDRYEEEESWEDDEEEESNEEGDGAGNAQDEEHESNTAEDKGRNLNKTTNEKESNDAIKDKRKMKAKTKHIVWKELTGAKQKVNEKHHSKENPNSQQFWNNVLPHYLTLK